MAQELSDTLYVYKLYVHVQSFERLFKGAEKYYLEEKNNINKYFIL